MATPNPPVIFPPYNDATAGLKAQLAEDAWNTEDPQRRNRDVSFQGRDAFRAFLGRKWQRELDYGLRKELWAFTDDRLSCRINDYPIAPSERRIALP